MATGPDGAEARASWARSAEHWIGTVVGGKYRIEAILGRGGMGTIYRAVQEPLGRQVALKVLHSNLGDADADPEFAKRFLLEAATLSKLAHPNIVVVHDYGKLDGGEVACFMAMELLEGRTINQVLDEVGAFSPTRALKITRDIARALRAAHDLGVIHRDLKPANAMLCPSPEGELVKVLDFGLVKVLRDDSEELTAEGRFLGSPRYMSPEQIQRTPMDGRSDLYSLGIILYRMLSNEVPFSGDHAVQTLMAHLTEPVPRIQERTGIFVPPPVEALMMKLLAKKPADRHANAGELIAAIDVVWSQLSEDPLPRSAEMSVAALYTQGLLSAEHTSPSLAAQRALLAGGGASPASGMGSLPFGAGTSGAVQALDASGSYVALPSGSLTLSSAGVPVAPPSRLPLILAVLVVCVVGLLLGVGSVALLSGGDARDTSSADPGPVPTPRVEPDPVPRVEPPSTATFTLRITSEPPGGVVERDGVVLGVTPLAVQLDPAGVSVTPARFAVRMDGRRTMHIEQGPATGEVTREVLMIPAPPTATGRGGGRRGGGRRGGETTSTTPTGGEPSGGGGTGGDLSIKTSR